MSQKQHDNVAIIVLGTQSSLKLLTEAECWLMDLDGTFDVVHAPVI